MYALLSDQPKIKPEKVIVFHFLRPSKLYGRSWKFQNLVWGLVNAIFEDKIQFYLRGGLNFDHFYRDGENVLYCIGGQNIGHYWHQAG